MVDSYLFDGGMADCVFHCDERNPKLRKGWLDGMSVVKFHSQLVSLLRLCTSPLFFHILC